MKKAYQYIIVIAVLAVMAFTIKFRIDLTNERRYSISRHTAEMLSQIEEPIHIELYLGGKVTADIARLKQATNDMIEEFNVRTKGHISYHYTDPSDFKTEEERYKNYYRLEEQGLQGMTMSDKDSEGRITQQTIFPCAHVIMHGDTIPITLMTPGMQQTIEESVNEAIAGLEYQLSDGIRILTRRDNGRIAFIEGHGELDELHTYDAAGVFSRYFDVDRGILHTDPQVLDPYKAIIIAKPMKKFSERDKFIIDQYIMRSGKVMWLLDATEISRSELSQSGLTPIMPLDVNLQDMLFRYGARIESAVVQDRQCLTMPVNVARPDEAPQYQQIPWTYMPLLLVSPYSTITKNIMEVKSELPAFITLTSSENGIKMEPLLITSNASHVDMAPNQINLNEMTKQDPETYFNQANMPVAVLMEGEFPSVFQNRMIPDSIEGNPQIINKSKKTRMILVADGDIIKNDIEQDERGVAIIGMGTNRITGERYGNRDFILNALLYLTDEEGWMDLRNRTFKLRLLNKSNVSSHRLLWQLFNVITPTLLVMLCGGIYLFLRRKKQA